jgi:hypothetical protein
MPNPIPAMTVTIQVHDGATVRLNYDPVLEAALPIELRRTLFRAYAPCTSVTMVKQGAQHSFADVIALLKRVP